MFPAVVVGLFALKVAWNVLVLYDVLNDLRRGKRAPKSGVSMMFGVEIVLLAILVTTTVVIEAPSWMPRPAMTAVVGAVAIAASYLHMLIFIRLSNWIAGRSNQTGPPG